MSCPAATLYLRRFLCFSRSAGLAFGLAVTACTAFAMGPEVPAGSPLINLQPFVVDTSAEEEEPGYDPTGMGMMEAERYDSPFSNEIIWEELPDEDVNPELDRELQAISGVSEAEIAASGVRLRLRGFPTPQLRDGYSQTGVPERVSVRRAQTIQGPLIPVLGRGAPGGIRNYLSDRPRARPRSVLKLGWSDRIQTLDAQTTGLLHQKKVWQRMALQWQKKNGPQEFAGTESLGFAGALTVRPSRRTSVMFQLDYQDLRGNPSPAVPEYRLTRGSPVIGPYRPLAHFHAYGPDAGVRKKVGSGTLQVETQLAPRIALRASAQGLWRELVSDRFTRGVLQLDTGIFGGTRQPIHLEQPLRLAASQVDLTARFSALGLEHKLFLALEHIRTRAEREQRALTAADRLALLPADVRAFDPAAPNYYRPPYSPETYRRVMIDREEATAYRGVLLSDRTALADGRLVVTFGGRLDAVDLDLTDRRENAPFPRLNDRTQETTWHAGANLVIVPRRLLAFANASTAFEPSTRVDARTGRIQGNETTDGFEFGLKGLLPKRLNYTLLYFDFTNGNISRRNPRYDDPALDPNLTEPELVAAGEEKFRGGMADLRLQLAGAWRVNLKATYTDAITTRSPDLPEEEGLPLARLPRLTASVSSGYAWKGGPLEGTKMGVGATYVDDFVFRYERNSQAFLAYPSSTLVNAYVAYGWKAGRARHELALRVFNLVDRDLLAALAQPGRDREIRMQYNLQF